VEEKMERIKVERKDGEQVREKRWEEGRRRGADIEKRESL
jgi:hypothetical protein